MTLLVLTFRGELYLWYSKLKIIGTLFILLYLIILLYTKTSTLILFFTRNSFCGICLIAALLQGSAGEKFK